MIFTPTRLQETTRLFLSNSPLVLISGVLAMTAGLSIVNTHNVWVLDWTLIVTLLAGRFSLGGRQGSSHRLSWTKLAAR
jgi:NhaP-type Na+/H+ or K+/H+ antiporter